GASTRLPVNAASVAGEPPPETPKLRLLWSPVICLAPQYVAEELLRTEGFTEVAYVNQPRWNDALRHNEIDLSLLFGPPQVVQINTGAPIVVIAGSHAGCVELIARPRIRSRKRRIGRVVVATVTDRPWSQYFCCMAIGNRDFVRRNPVATKRFLRAMLK